MKIVFKNVLLLFSVITNNAVTAQEVGPSPEVEQMYQHAQEYTAMGDFADAITTYKQAILLAPQKVILYEGLGNVFYLSGKYNEAEQTLGPLISKAGAGARCYDLLSACQVGQKKMKEARATVLRGLDLFPGSGLLYNREGLIYDLEKKKGESINAWLHGIYLDSAYAPNYYNIALAYLAADSITWGILYAETYLAMDHDTIGDQLLKKQLFDGYKAMFEHIAGNGIPQYGNTGTSALPGSFIGAVQQIYGGLTPVISDGITVGNLTMVRTRFLMDWVMLWATKYPFSLFSYQDELVRNGYFDIYNEWLFGKAEREIEYDGWNKFHDGDMDRFLVWRSVHELIPRTSDFNTDSYMQHIKK